MDYYSGIRIFGGPPPPPPQYLAGPPPPPPQYLAGPPPPRQRGPPPPPPDVLRRRSNSTASGESGDSDESSQTPGYKPSGNEIYTISADRTRDSEFELKAQILTALRSEETGQQYDDQLPSPIPLSSSRMGTGAGTGMETGMGRGPNTDMNMGIPGMPGMTGMGMGMGMGGGIGMGMGMGGNVRSGQPQSSPSYTIPGRNTLMTPRKNYNSQSRSHSFSTGHVENSRRLALNHDKWKQDTTNIPQAVTEGEYHNGSYNQPAVTSNAMFDDYFRTIAKALEVPEESATDLESLRTYISRFQTNRIQVLPELRSQTIYRVHHQHDTLQMYLDNPHWVRGANGKDRTLMGNLPIDDIDLYLQRNPEVCFIIYRDFRKSLAEKDSNDAMTGPKYQHESIAATDPILTTTITHFMDIHGFNTDQILYAESVYSLDTDDSFLTAPYLALYHTQGNTMDLFLKSLNHSQRQQFRLLLDYVYSQYGKEYDTVREMTANGRIERQFLRYLFKPGDVVVRKNGDGISGFLCNSWVTENLVDENEIPPRREKKDSTTKRYSMEVRHWVFEGAFSCVTMNLGWRMATNNTLDLDIDELTVYPLSYAQRDLVDKLRRRGEMFWKCRTRRLVSYHEDASRKVHCSGDERYMIDMTIYRELHKFRNEEKVDDLGPEAMKQDNPPSDQFLYLLPMTIKGFNIRKKKWVDLKVDNIGDVVWNKRAFDSLVLENKTKQLIQALISDQIEPEKSTDLISGKGNGLIMLLHGGPGTGKTLTAESVAEIAQKPLYPVTCGDIGTKPEDVEKYLESVLYLGKTWGCVVLLDEADVFLEQRSLEDLHRNALVSVFLRILEYYEGILILTSNRVGTFDEAFKSRIQLAIHYKNLTFYQRTEIWGNFIQRLKVLNENEIDFLDLKDHIEDLAQFKMNGREIRNAITLARQYTRWERKQQLNPVNYKLSYMRLKFIIETAGKFDQYIEKLNGGFSHDQIAEDEGLRLANDAA